MNGITTDFTYSNNMVNKITTAGIPIQYYYDDKKNLYLGRDEYGKMAYFTSEKDVLGEFLMVKITKTGGMSLYGEIVK